MVRFKEKKVLNCKTHKLVATEYHYIYLIEVIVKSIMCGENTYNQVVKSIAQL